MDKDDLPQERHEEQQQPVAYDADGRPLYAAPSSDPSYTQQPAPQFVHLSRSADPIEPAISDELKAKHEASLQEFPDLNLSEVEYIIDAVPRHEVGIIKPLLASGLAIAVIAAFIFNYSFILSTLNIMAVAPPAWMIWLGGSVLIAAIALSCYAAIWIFNSNRLYLTNESIIQEIQEGLFTHREQTISLANIEDASYSQVGPLQLLFNFGTIRLSTEGDETTYAFSYAANPRQQIAILNNAVEDFKNGRPVRYEEK